MTSIIDTVVYDGSSIVLNLKPEQFHRGQPRNLFDIFGVSEAVVATAKGCIGTHAFPNPVLMLYI